MPSRPPVTLRIARLVAPPEACHVADVRHGPWPSSEHRHDFFEVFLVRNGSGVEIVDGTERPIQTGSLACVAAGDRHRFLGDPEVSFLNVAFAPGRWSSLRRRYGDTLDNRFAGTPDTRRVDLGLDEARQVDAAADPLRRSCRSRIALDGFLLTVDRVLSTTARTPTDALGVALCDPGVLRAGVDALVDAVGLTHAHVARVCRRRTGKTPTQLVNDARLDHAAGLLERTDCSVTDACYDSGFNHLGHFHRLFKQRFGSTPRRYRLRISGVVPAVSPPGLARR